MNEANRAMVMRVPNGVVLSVAEIGVRGAAFFISLFIALSVGISFGVDVGSKAGLLGLSAVAVLLTVWFSSRIEERIRQALGNASTKAVFRSGQGQFVQAGPVEGLPLALQALRHDIRGGLALTNASLELLERRAIDDALLAEIRVAREGLKRVARRVDELTDLASSLMLEGESFDVSSPIDRAIAFKVRDLRLHDISLEKRISPDTPEVQGSSFLILEALRIVVENAIDAIKNNPGDRELTITSGPSPGGVYLDVRDTGPGIPAEVGGMLFNEPVSTKGGMGRGLLLAKEILERYHGSISFETSPGKGTVFHLQLPTAAGHSTGAGEPRRHTSEHPQKPRVLVIDDEPNLVSRVFTELATRGYNVDAALTLDDAWERIHEQQYDTILLDIVFPASEHGMTSGLDLLTRLRAENPKLATKVILVTGYGELAQLKSAMEAHAQGVIFKPFTFDEILEVLPSIQ